MSSPGIGTRRPRARSSRARGWAWDPGARRPGPSDRASRPRCRARIGLHRTSISGGNTATAFTPSSMRCGGANSQILQSQGLPSPRSGSFPLQALALGIMRDDVPGVDVRQPRQVARKCGEVDAGCFGNPQMMWISQPTIWANQIAVASRIWGRPASGTIKNPARFPGPGLDTLPRGFSFLFLFHVSELRELHRGHKCTTHRLYSASQRLFCRAPHRWRPWLDRKL